MFRLSLDLAASLFSPETTQMSPFNPCDGMRPFDLGRGWVSLRGAGWFLAVGKGSRTRNRGRLGSSFGRLEARNFAGPASGFGACFRAARGALCRTVMTLRRVVYTNKLVEGCLLWTFSTPLFEPVRVSDGPRPRGGRSSRRVRGGSSCSWRRTPLRLVRSLQTFSRFQMALDDTVATTSVELTSNQDL